MLGNTKETVSRGRKRPGLRDDSVTSRRRTSKTCGGMRVGVCESLSSGHCRLFPGPPRRHRDRWNAPARLQAGPRQLLTQLRRDGRPARTVVGRLSSATFRSGTDHRGSMGPDDYDAEHAGRLLRAEPAPCTFRKTALSKLVSPPSPRRSIQMNHGPLSEMHSLARSVRDALARSLGLKYTRSLASDRQRCVAASAASKLLLYRCEGSWWYRRLVQPGGVGLRTTPGSGQSPCAAGWA